MINRKVILSIFVILAVFFIICLIYAHYEYTQLKVKTIEIVSKDIPEEFNGKENCISGRFPAGHLFKI